MPLPKLNVGTHILKLPSSGKEIEYRPFLVKEEKIFMTAMESGETADTLAAARSAKQQGCHTIAICNVPGSRITREVDG